MTTPAPDEATIARLAARVLEGGALGVDDARALAAVDHRGELIYDLFYWANKVRTRFVGRSVKFCSIVTGKVGGCSEDCHYCSQSKHFKTHVNPSRMRVEQMAEAADEARANGASSFGIVNSGRGPTDKELDWLEPFFKDTAAKHHIRPCATLGELRPDQAQRLRAMGVERINHNLETSRRHFGNICTTHTYDDRVRTIRAAKAAGLSICSGGIFGLGETWDDRIDMAVELRELGADVVPINFLVPIEGTPAHTATCSGGQSSGGATLEPLEALKIVALYRFLLPDRELKIAGGREKVLRDLQSWVFFAGGSSFLIGNYLTTFGRSPQQDHQMLADLGLAYTSYDEVEHEADPGHAAVSGPGANAIAGRETAPLVRRRGAVVELPVVG